MPVMVQHAAGACVDHLRRDLAKLRRKPESLLESNRRICGGLCLQGLP